MAVVNAATVCALLCLAVTLTDCSTLGLGLILVSGGRNTRAAEVPWHAGIYIKGAGSFSQHCGGTLVATKTVITAAHCFWDEAYSTVTNSVDKYKVVLGKYHRSWDVHDAGTQIMDVANITLHDRYRGRRRNYEYDVAIVQLVEEAQITITTRLADIDWANRYQSLQLSDGSEGIVAGWGLTEGGVPSRVLKSVTLPYVDPLVCYDMLDENLQPLVTTDKFCAGHVGRNTSVCHGDSGGGLVFRRYDRATEEVSFYLRGVVSVAFRPPGNEDPCYAQQVTGFAGLGHEAVVRWMKKFPFYEQRTTEMASDSGCGIRHQSQALIYRGNAAADAEFPWHAGIYQVSEDGKHTLLCSGTLIKPNVVVTAAHCVWDDAHQRPRSNTSVRVALGKHLQEWATDLQDRNVQRHDVDEIFMWDFLGWESNFENDIAFVRLAINAAMTRRVNVACVDFVNGISPLKNGSVGTIAGWGLTEADGNSSPDLRWVDMPYVDRASCRRNIERSHKNLLTNDKFCAGHLNQSVGLCAGDSGGGFLFQNTSNMRYYLRGVASIALGGNGGMDRCTKITAFTSVAEHLHRLKEYLLA